jgi:hypothetical protein
MQIASSCPRSVTSQERLQQIAIAVRQQTGYINLLMINAGMAGPGLSTPNPRAVVAEFIRNVWSIPMPDFNTGVPAELHLRLLHHQRNAVLKPLKSILRNFQAHLTTCANRSFSRAGGRASFVIYTDAGGS